MNSLNLGNRILSRQAEYEAAIKKQTFLQMIANEVFTKTKEANEKLLEEQQENNDKLKMLRLIY